MEDRQLPRDTDFIALALILLNVQLLFSLCCVLRLLRLF